jgi:hypothetical protein
MGKVFLAGIYVKHAEHLSERFWDLCMCTVIKKQRLVEMMQIKTKNYSLTNLSKTDMILEEGYT